jgi:malate dehydrogenase (oxaloacetate-decarboxylating)
MDGRSMNNALAYPGIFRGALDVRARRITAEMKLAAARTLADAATDQLLPDMLDHGVHKRVAAAVASAWRDFTAESRRGPPSEAAAPRR